MNIKKVESCYLIRFSRSSDDVGRTESGRYFFIFLGCPFLKSLETSDIHSSPETSTRHAKVENMSEIGPCYIEYKFHRPHLNAISVTT